ncbi:chitin binding peritrophin-A-like protein [Chitinophaga dinghuensis]|uniref:Chitin binding peritrophin-A-like protein n=2 Tax=Chitinophaga dinghuensis TaxID=1539050 RepID=A0A327VTQ9_9BACT|nr:chitin binding peritrophin-A-like protein [Chitinophaga dinghuensis]
MAAVAALGIFTAVHAQTYMRDPQDCSKFYKCENGTKIEFTCSPGLVFNMQTQVCDWPQNTDCDGGFGFADASSSSDGLCPLLGVSNPVVCGTITVAANTEVLFELDANVDLTKYVKIAEVVVNGKTMVKYRSKETTTRNLYMDTCPGYAGFCTKTACQ